MLFNTPAFFLFLFVVLGAFYLLPRWGRKPLLLVASYFFYMSWNPKFVALLLTLTAIDYTAALLIAHTQEPRRRKAMLLVSLAANLGFLGFFKYFNFLGDNLAALLGKPAHAFALDIVLPLGISFHTFQSISYVVDVYRRQQAAVRSPLDYALFIAFFPQLVAGPIVRARDFFRDLHHWSAPAPADQLRGVLLIALGLAKKVALADQFAQIADQYFRAPSAHPGMLPAWSGAFAFAMQIYFDFSGYTDMAIGMAKLFGFHFPVNFRRPYLATSITDFWRRWHISLSSWLRDYLYIPMGGNRGGRLRTYRNLLLTMLLGGLWHGASWNFVVWGGYHGVLLAIERATGESKRLIRIPLTFMLVLLGWVFFRAATFSDSLYVLRAMFSSTEGEWLVPVWLLALLAVAFILAVAEERAGWFDKLASGPAWAYAAACAALLAGVELFGVAGQAVPFVYFQF
jgi:D-alanyl-lipoteichoic acid acyltransferase DltB (MBOAT superfamily)